MATYFERIRKGNNNIAEVEAFLLSHSCNGVEWKLSSSEIWGDHPQVSITSVGESKFIDPIHVHLNVEDENTVEVIDDLFCSIPTELLEAIAGTRFEQKWGIENPMSIDEGIRRWAKFLAWVQEHYTGFPETGWLINSHQPENLLHWAARVILGGVKPSKIGLALLREGKAIIGDDGYLRLPRAEALWEFDHHNYDGTQSVGIAGERRLVGKPFNAVFTSETSRVCKATKIPEEWEMKLGIFKGFTSRELTKIHTEVNLGVVFRKVLPF